MTLGRRLLAALALLAAAAFSQPVLAERVALVIGNAAYENTPPLATPKTDAYAFADFLRASDFRVTEVIDASRAEMTAALEAFVAALGSGDTAVFYYAGHGLQADGKNYLMSVDAKLQTSFDIAAESVELQQVVTRMEARAGTVMIFIDACRDNPLATRLASDTRGLAVGLAPVEAHGEGTMIAFAATPGQVASNGTASSPFTAALIKNLGAPDLEVATAFKRVIRDVREATADRQVPQLISTMSVEFYFHVDQPVAQGVILDGMEPPTLTVTVPEPEPAPATTVAALPDPAPTPKAEPTEMELDAAAASRIGTLRALQLFLVKYRYDNLPPTAVVDIVKAIDTRHRSVNTQAEVMEAELRLDLTARRAVQRLLSARGYDPGGADGSLGPASRRQIAAFQESMHEKPTGYLTTQTLVALGVPVPRELGVVSGATAQRFNPADLGRLETDERLIAALKCIGSRKVTYGFFEDHVYVAIQGAPDGYDAIVKQARQCGGYVASLTSAAENEFVFGMLTGDPSWFSYYQDEGSASISGPTIGFRQSERGAEPGRGWSWASGEQARFTAWAQYQPDNWQNTEDFAEYWFHVPRGKKPGDPGVAYKATWNDSSGTAGSYILEIE